MSPTFLVLASLVATALGHGRVLDPPSRATAWRVGFPTRPNYDDDGLNCGGFAVQYSTNGGKCGICGDAYNMREPRPHELGGVYGEGVIVAHYAPGSPITAKVQLTTSHLGFWEFKLCPDPERNDQECFDQYVLELESGGTRYYPTKGSTTYSVDYKLPKGLVCDHCVLQWRYTAGNNWGICANGTQGLGCGNQEQFGACSDVHIGMLRTGKMEQDENAIPYPLAYYLKNGFFDAQQGVIHLLNKSLVRPNHRESTNTRTKITHENDVNPNDTYDDIWGDIKQQVRERMKEINRANVGDTDYNRGNAKYNWYETQNVKENDKQNKRPNIIDWSGEVIKGGRDNENNFLDQEENVKPKKIKRQRTKMKVSKYKNGKNAKWSKPKRYKRKRGKRKLNKKSRKPRKRKKVSYYWR